MMKLIKREKKETKWKMDHGRLSVDCRNCEHAISDRNECVRCLCNIISINGEPERILLRTGKDTEYFGDSVIVINGLAKINGLAGAISRERRRSKKCSVCARAPWKLIKNAWSSFPAVDLEQIRSALNGFEPVDKNCEECVMQSYRSIEQLDFALSEFAMTAARTAFSLTEV